MIESIVTACKYVAILELGAFALAVTIAYVTFIALSTKWLWTWTANEYSKRG